MDSSTVLIWIAVFLAWLLYKKVTKTYQIFEERGIPFEKAIPVLGNNFSLLSGKESLYDLYQRLYTKFSNEK